MDPTHSAKSSGANITVDFLRDRIRHDRDAGDLRPLTDYLAVFSAEESMVAQAYFSVCQESTPPAGSPEATLLNRSTRTSMLAASVGGPASPAGGRLPEGAEFVGPYRLIKELGRGGQGAVHLSEDTRLGRRVALKVLTGVGSLTDANLRRFHREAELASKLDHPAICAVFDFGAFEGVPYIAMRFVEGETLAKRIATAKTPDVKPGASEHIAIDDEPETIADEVSESHGTTKVQTTELIRIMEKAARAIHAAHEAGVIHRDLKPGNIMVDAAGDPVVLDFGLARDLEGDGVSLTKSGDFLGTPAYMSPEQIAAGHIHLDRRSDVYSLGVTLFECITLRRPFDAPTREALYQSILSKEPPDARRLNKSVSADLKVVLETALNKDRDKRYATAEALADDLRRVVEMKPILAKPISPVGKLIRWARRNPGIAVATTVAFLSLSIGLVATLIQKTIADQNATRAEKSAFEATSNLQDFEKLADGRILEELVHEANTRLWPATDERVPAIEGWLRRARDLGSRLEIHGKALAALRSHARPYDDAAKALDQQAHLESTNRIGVLVTEAEQLKKQIEGMGSDNGNSVLRKRLEERLAAAEAEKRQLEARVTERLTWDFDDPVDRFKHANLAVLVRDLTAFMGDRWKGGPTIKEVEERLEFARTHKKRTVDDYAAAWKDTISAIAKSPLYRGLPMKEQIGLIPIGADPVTKLQEFTELQTGNPVKRDSDGTIELEDDSAMVFVLLPGGTFWMGAQRDKDKDEPNYDPDARLDENPPHEITLAPFFISKFEMTQGQWRKFTHTVPSLQAAGHKYFDKTISWTNPVEQVSWFECSDVLARLGFVLPTEAQWECAARGGTSTVWWFGSDPKELATHGNVSDQTRKQVRGQGTSTFEAWDDGWVLHAPAGTFPANPFGLHEVAGNVWEWCLDGKGWYSATFRAGDGLRTTVEPKVRVIRGGAYGWPASNSRSACRGDLPPASKNAGIGVRPARPVKP